MKAHFAAALFALVATPVAAAMTAEDVARCTAMSKTLPGKVADLEQLVTKRDALAEAAELKGEAWENAEALRAFGAGEAAEADATRAAYDAARSDFEAADAAVRSVSAMVNQDVAAYNRACAAK